MRSFFLFRVPFYDVCNQGLNYQGSTSHFGTTSRQSMDMPACPDTTLSRQRSNPGCLKVW
jgi:hypothetical protein